MLWILLHFVHLGQPDGVRPNRSILVVTPVYKLDTLLASLEYVLGYLSGIYVLDNPTGFVPNSFALKITPVLG